jgi:hypothetical protein
MRSAHPTHFMPLDDDATADDDDAEDLDVDGAPPLPPVPPVPPDPVDSPEQPTAELAPPAIRAIAKIAKAERFFILNPPNGRRIKRDSPTTNEKIELSQAYSVGTHLWSSNKSGSDKV